MSSESPNPASIPSVARTRTSPGRTSSVAVLTLGSSCPGMPLPSASEPLGRIADRSPLSTRPSTVPTPSQVIVLSDGEMNARLIAAPRVPRRALWQRSASRTRSRLGLSRTTSPATRAEWAASLPCPRPSIAATLDVRPGDVLVLATDGIEAGFGDSLDISGTTQAITERILAAHRKPTDDALVVAIRYLGVRP